jgi:hypothetical protein
MKQLTKSLIKVLLVVIVIADVLILFQLYGFLQHDISILTLGLLPIVIAILYEILIILIGSLKESLKWFIIYQIYLIFVFFFIFFLYQIGQDIVATFSTVAVSFVPVLFLRRVVK